MVMIASQAFKEYPV